MTREDTWNRLVELGVVKGEITIDRWNLSGVDLSGVDLSGADLSSAKLWETDLSRANLIEANLSGADLSRAKLWETDLSRANLIEANLSGANLREANLSGADLSRANLREAKLIMANLVGANLREGDLYYANLRDANLRDANLSEADLSEASLLDSNFTNSKLSGVCLHKANMAGWKIEGVTCTHIRQYDEKNGGYQIIQFQSSDEFAKRFSVYENVLEMVLDIPYSFVTKDIGDLIVQAFNHMAGSEALSSKGVESLFDDGTTLYKFLVRDPEMINQIRKLINSIPEELNRMLKPELDNILREIKATVEDIHTKEDEPIDMLEEATGLLKLTNINLVPGIELHSKKVNDMVFEMAVKARYNRIGGIVFGVVERLYR